MSSLPKTFTPGEDDQGERRWVIRPENRWYPYSQVELYHDGYRPPWKLGTAPTRQQLALTIGCHRYEIHSFFRHEGIVLQCLRFIDWCWWNFYELITNVNLRAVEQSVCGGLDGVPFPLEHIDASFGPCTGD